MFKNKIILITGGTGSSEICIGNMKFARGAKAVREAKKEPEQ